MSDPAKRKGPFFFQHYLRECDSSQKWRKSESTDRQTDRPCASFPKLGGASKIHGLIASRGLPYMTSIKKGEG